MQKEALALSKRIRDRIQKEAGDLDALSKLQESNPELATLCEDLDEIITHWGFDQVKIDHPEHNPLMK